MAGSSDLPAQSEDIGQSTGVALGSTVTTSAVGDAAAGGSGTTASKVDHLHGRESFATPGIVLGTAAAAGAALTPIRSDSTIAAFDATNPATSVVGDAAVVGVAAKAARRDHVHARELAALADILWGTDTVLGSNGGIQGAQGTALIIAATQYFVRIPILRSGTVSNISYMISTGGGTITHCYVALYSSAGTMLSQSADQSANWVTPASYTTALGAGQAVTAGTFVWAMFYTGTATTAPTFRITMPSAVPAAWINIGAPAAALRSGKLALADTATMPSVTPTNISSAANIPIAAILT